jgi:hypothetical protein
MIEKRRGKKTGNMNARGMELDRRCAEMCPDGRMDATPHDMLDCVEKKEIKKCLTPVVLVDKLRRWNVKKRLWKTGADREVDG